MNIGEESAAIIKSFPYRIDRAERGALLLKIPEIFRERYCRLVDEPEAFLAALGRPLPKTFRVNRLKAGPEDVKRAMESYGFRLTAIPWYDDAFISDSLEINSTLEHFTGQIYIQELVSMLPPVLARKELEQARIVLDACAAPGSKTTQIAAMMRNEGTLVANDIDYSRIRALKFNLEKAGAVNAVITNYDLQHMPGDQYDVVILDAPCSAEGTLRKNDRLFDSWNTRSIASYSGNQRMLILKAFDMLAPGGTMVYSTCTFAPEENELVVDHLLKNRSEATLEPIKFDGLRTEPGIGEWDGRHFDSRVSSCARIFPHHNDTGGFFMARVGK
jgi:NOL1/NOP2/sun family putative RNA methylase